MANEGIAEIFLEIADLLDLEGVKFKPEAYRRAARTLQQLPDDVRDLVRTGEIDDVPGIGEALSEKVREFVSTGKVHYLEKLRSQWPPGLLELMRLEGVGPKTTRRFYLEFQVEGPADLARILQEGKLQGVFGFGDRKIELLRKALARARSGGGEKGGAPRTPLPEAQERVDLLLEALRAAGAPCEKLVYAGSLRRRRETVGDLDMLATSQRPKEVMEKFTHLEDVEEVRLSGETKSTVVLKGGLQVDLRVVAPEAFGAAWQYFTGSKDHNVRLRSIANKKGFSINEYGLTRGERLVPAPTEEEVYAAVGMAWVPPEMREDQGEIEAATSGKLPRVVADTDLRGELHIHVPASFDRTEADSWVEASRALGLSYGGFVLRALDLEASRKSLPEMRKELPRELSGVRIYLGVELPAGPQGWPEAPRGAEFLLVRPPEKPPSDVAKWKAALLSRPPPVPAIWTHFGAEDLAAAGLTWKDLLGGAGTTAALEVAVSHEKVVAETARVREASQAAAPVLLSGWPRLPEELARLRLAAGVARRGWTVREQVLNAQEDPTRPGPAPPSSPSRRRGSAPRPSPG